MSSSSSRSRELWTLSSAEVRQASSTWRKPANLWAMPALLLRKFCEISVYTALLAVPLVYSLSLSDAVNERIQALDMVFWFTQIQPYLTGGVPVLELKFFTWAVAGTLLLVAYAMAKAFEGLTGAVVFPVARDAVSDSPWSGRLILGSIGAFLVFSFASLFLWMPPPPPQSPLPGSAAFVHGVVAWSQVVFAFAFFVALEDMLRGRTFAYRILGFLLSTGFICALMTVLLQVRPFFVDWFWVKFPPEESRNQLGSFIGHNTGLSSFLMAPFFVGGAILVGRAEAMTLRSRVLLAVLLSVIALALVLAQSRAVVPIVVAGSVVGLYLIWRLCAIEPPRVLFWAVPVLLAAIVLSQVVDSPMNVLKRRDVTLLQRLKDLSVPRLVAETRLRILVVGIPMVLKDPFIGRGWGTFHYVYPEVQGRFFAEHPRSMLAPTAKRSMHAHNEYLQTAIEVGLTGLLLALAGLAVVIRRGWLALRATLDPGRMAVQVGILVAVVGYLVHALADFPFRVPPIALTVVTLLALLSSGGRVWRVPVRTSTPVEEIPQRRLLPPTYGAAAMVAGLFLIFATGVAWAFARVATPWYSAVQLATVSETKMRRAEDLMVAGLDRNLDAARELFGSALSDTQEALYLQPRHGSVLYQRAVAYYFGAIVAATRAERLQASGQAEAAASARAEAARNATTGIQFLDMSLSELNYDHPYYQRYLMNLLLANNDPTRRDSALTAGLANLEHAVRLNPTNGRLVRELVDQWDRRSLPREEQIRELLGMVEHFDPAYFRAEFIETLIVAQSLGDYPMAHRWAVRLSEAVPDDIDLRLQRIQQTILVGRLAEAGQLLTFANRTAPNSLGVLMMNTVLGVRSRQDDAVLQLVANEIPKFPEVPPAIPAAIEAFLLSRDPRTAEDGRAAIATLEGLIEREYLNLQRIAVVAYEIFGDPALALPWLERLVNHNDPEPDLQVLMLTARSYVALGRPEDARRLLPEIRRKAATPIQRRVVQAFVASLPERRPPASGS